MRPSCNSESSFAPICDVLPKKGGMSKPSNSSGFGFLNVRFETSLSVSRMVMRLASATRMAP